MKTNFLLVAGLLLCSGFSFAQNNVFMGETPPSNVTAGNTSATGPENVGVGYSALHGLTLGDRNVAFGFKSLNVATTAKWNCAFGHQTLMALTTGTGNVAIGRASMQNSSAGDYNVGIGYGSLVGTTGNNNIGIGSQVLPGATGSENIALGSSAGASVSSGGSNVLMGYRAGFKINSGYSNVSVGQGSANDLTTGYANTFVGPASGYGISTGYGNTIIGNAIISNPDLQNTVILSDGANHHRFYIHSNGYAGIGLGNNVIPNNMLEVKSAAANSSGLRFTRLTSAYTPSTTDSKFLTVDANGDVVLRNMTASGGTSGTNLAISGNQISLTNPLTPGNSITLPAEVDGSVTNELQTLSLSGNVLSLSLGGGSVTLPQANTTTITAGANVTVTGDGSAATPYVINATGGGGSAVDTSIYANDGTINTISIPSATPGVRRVTLGENNLFFDTSSSSFANGTSGNGRIYIGNSTSFPNLNATGPNVSQYRLLVEGGVLTEKVKVAMRSSSNWADYVFSENYVLKPLSEVESFINENKHLPGVESADTLAKDGLDLGDMQARQMEKIEELTLYAIQQNKTLEKQAAEIAELKAQVNALLSKK